MNLFRKTGARFSPCGTWRYSLFREWDTNLPTILYVMLNPSIANGEDNDPTVERCERRAAALGFGRLEIRNLFALVSTKPAMLRKHPDPIGPENDAAILECARGAAMTLCAWGTHGSLLHRDRAVIELLRINGIQPMCLRLTEKSGMPEHPLYIPYATKPIPFVV